MKRIAFITAAAAVGLTAFAQSKIDLPGRLIVNATNDLVSAATRSPESPVVVPLDVDIDRQYTVIVNLGDGISADDLAAKGLDIVSQRGDMLIARMTASDMQRYAAMPEVKRVSLGVKPVAYMDSARYVAGVDAVQSGEGLGGQYTGAGVIAGLMDMGLDVNHINFLDDDGEPRTKALWTIRGETGYVTDYLTPEAIKSFTTDDRTETHGTHVLGIMAGSYDGPAQYAFINSRGSTQVRTQTNSRSAVPYYGVATDAEIAVCCGDFDGSNVMIGAELIAQYAEEQGKPAVVNLSIGNNIGPHDGTDASSQYLAEVGKSAIVCIAAGNEGSYPISIEKTFSGSDNSFRTFVSRSGTTYGIADFWSGDSREFSVTFVAYNRTTGQAVYSYKLDSNLAGESVYITGDYYTAPGYIHDSTFNSSFGSQASVIFTSNLDANNNRYEVMVQYDLQGSGTNILPGFIVEGSSGATVYAYAFGSNNSTAFYSNDVAGYIDGTPDCSISGMACGDNVLVVGSYGNKEKWPVIQGSSLTDRSVAGEISSFSSYGTTFDGRQLPEVCGPGGAVVSSYSTYYINYAGYGDDRITAHYAGTDRDSYWMAMSGTSMATPFVTGVIATWLQADPTLTIDDVKQIISETATNDAQTAVTPERWGYGKINALAGIKKILGLSGVSDIKADDAEVLISRTGDGLYEVYVQGADNVKAELYSIDGKLAAATEAAGDSVTVDASALRGGVYVLRVSCDGNAVKTEKLAVR